jgi:hypothetical protein
VRAPDYAAPLIGWRVWLVVETSGGLRLSSVIHDEVWPARAELDAVCRRRDDPFAEPVEAHDAPAAHCGCGIHAAREPATVLPYLRGRDDPWTVARVLGTVSLWGDVVEHADGWRASRAYPASILVPPEAAALVEPLGAYGVPVTRLAEEASGRSAAA